ncbi:MAG: type 1 glutamine amidotransferase [Candidatus Accumulibacter sp.]|jgi:GMP synthase-like glutamine amidotransferase|nr:type 1 glutamine amidotransferase [Accumulibacter sp.]
MKPVAIFRHTRTESPGYFATFLDRRSIPWRLIKIDEGDPVPDSVAPFSGICLMGGTISVNDPLPWIERSCALIREAIAGNVPVIGHCLGGQLMSKALGGEVTKNPVKEIGWGTARVEPGEEAARWFASAIDDPERVTVFQWHGETFSLPPGAARLLGNPFCANQMFALGPHLGMQCHVEMTEAMIKTWNKGWENETRGLDPLPESVQTPEEMQRQIPARLPALRRLAEQLYSVWIRGLARD